MVVPAPSQGERRFSIPKGKPYVNLLEPPALVQSFIDYPPNHFKAWLTAQHVPMFSTELDLLLFADDFLKRVSAYLPFPQYWRRMLMPNAAFVGTTVSEYALFPPGLSAEQLVEGIKAYQRRYPIVVIKDIPKRSPLLDEKSNAYAEAVKKACHEAGFILIEGQDLAYIPVDFASIDEYLARLSRVRRKDIKRKLHVRHAIDLEILPTGSDYFSRDYVLNSLYALYMNVYHQSDIHFDLLSFDFFKAVLQDTDDKGRVFLYRHQGELVGFNLCFIYDGNLVDKYIGLLYPQARKLNLYFVSWIVNLEFALEHGLKFYIAGWTDPGIKAYLGALFTMTQDAVYVRNPLLRALLRKLSGHFRGE